MLTDAQRAKASQITDFVNLINSSTWAYAENLNKALPLPVKVAQAAITNYTSDVIANGATDTNFTKIAFVIGASLTGSDIGIGGSQNNFW
jgi:hypothetical protein